MRTIQIILIFTLLLSLSSCEQDVTGVSLPYKEQLVLRAVLNAGSKIENVRLERTLPPLDVYSEEKALVSNAIMIIDNGFIKDTLKYSNGYYSSKLTAEVGKKYKINILWKGLKAYAETFVPEPADFNEIFFEFKPSTNSYGSPYVYYQATIYTLISPNEKYVYEGTVADGFNFYPTDEVSTYSQRNKDGKLRVNLTYTGGSDTNEIKRLIKNYKFVILSYDKQFYDYYITKYNGSSTDEIFGNVGTNVRWNVKGDGIGMFIGRTIVMKSIQIK